jgi:hypothetical protein
MGFSLDVTDSPVSGYGEFDSKFQSADAGADCKTVEGM